MFIIPVFWRENNLGGNKCHGQLLNLITGGKYESQNIA